MAKKSVKIIATIGAALLLGGCAGEFDAAEGLSQIQGLEEFNEPFSAPFKAGAEILTDKWFENPQSYLEEKYSLLTQAGLIEAAIGEKNSWRALVSVKLTQKGEEMLDVERTEIHEKSGAEDDKIFVHVCDLRPEKIVKITPIGTDTVEMTYTIVEKNLTPFGEYLGFAQGREHTHTRRFVKGTFSWDLLPAE